MWAELSEKISDVVDRAVKYGGGPEFIRQSLLQGSDLVARLENRVPGLPGVITSPEEVQAVADAMRELKVALDTAIRQVELLGRPPQ